MEPNQIGRIRVCLNSILNLCKRDIVLQLFHQQLILFAIKIGPHCRFAREEHRAVRQSHTTCLARKKYSTDFQICMNFDTMIIPICVCVHWIQVNTQFARICNIFFTKRDDLLLYTNEFGNIVFFDIRDGTALLQYNEVCVCGCVSIGSLESLTNRFCFIKTSSIEFENAICTVFFMDKQSVNARNLGPNPNDV